MWLIYKLCSIYLFSTKVVTKSLENSTLAVFVFVYFLLSLYYPNCLPKLLHVDFFHSDFAFLYSCVIILWTENLSFPTLKSKNIIDFAVKLIMNSRIFPSTLGKLAAIINQALVHDRAEMVWSFNLKGRHCNYWCLLHLQQLDFWWKFKKLCSDDWIWRLMNVSRINEAGPVFSVKNIFLCLLL